MVFFRLLRFDSKIQKFKNSKFQFKNAKNILGYHVERRGKLRFEENPRKKFEALK